MWLGDEGHLEQQMAEIAGGDGFEALLVLRVKFSAAAVCVAFGLARVDIGGGEPLVLPLIDQPGELAGGEALFVEIGGGDELLQQAKLIVGVEDREIAVEPDQLGVAAEHLRADRVEGAEPGHRSEEHTSELQSLMRI